MNICTVNLTPYQERAFIVANCTHDELNAWTKRRWNTAPKQRTLGGVGGEYFSVERDDGVLLARVVWLERFKWSMQEQAMAVHEFLHLALAVLRDLKIHNEQATAFLLQSVVEQVWFKWKRLR